MFGGTTAVKFLLAGGIAGVVSRTATAPFDRLKVFLITASPEELGVPRSQANMNFTDLAMKSVKEGAAKNGVSGAAQGAVVGGAKVAQKGSRAIVNAISSLYRGGGVRAFWVGNGVNSAKILPVSSHLQDQTLGPLEVTMFS
jgi:solute carrier family 25 phosphate transporter 23/24/25/41